MTQNPNIMITNDDGIESPGLRAAVEAVLDIGNVTVVAPSKQQTSSGRGLTGDKQSFLEPISYQANDSEVPAYHCDCSPALVVRHSLKTLFHENKPDLLISGINYGENLGINITGSGTVGAALEAASCGVPSIAIAKQTTIASHHEYSDQDWTASSYFLRTFAKLLLEKRLLPDVDVLKIDVPGDAATSTGWKITRLAKAVYYSKVFENPAADSRICDGKTVIEVDRETLDPDSDIYVFAIDRLVSVTPLSMDLTSRVNLSDVENLLST